MDKVQTTALRAARAAGRIHLQRLRRITIDRKSNAIDLVTEADRESEAAAVEIIVRAFPSHAILAEETGMRLGDADHRWIIDPLDGTTNFAHGYPQFCISIAYEHKGSIELGVVHDALKKETFVARRKQGAFLNGKRIKASRTPHLGQALIGTGFPYDRRQRRRFYLAFWESFMLRVQGVRRTGAAALDLCWVACGRLDGFWEFGLKPWDVAAGALIVEEASGQVSNIDGSPLDLEGGQILASNGPIHHEMVGLLAETRPLALQREASDDWAPEMISASARR